MDLNELRGNIDEIDKNLIALFEDRMKVAENIAECKIEMGKNVFDKEREIQKIQTVKSQTSHDENRDAVGEFFTKIMEISRKRQYDTLKNHGVSDLGESTDPAFSNVNTNLILFNNGTYDQKLFLDSLVFHSGAGNCGFGNSDDLIGAEPMDITECMSFLIKECSKRGFYGNLWHDYLALMLVSDENAYSLASEMRGDVGGTLRDMALCDMKKFKSFFDIDFTLMTERLGCPEFKFLLDYKAGDNDSKLFNKRVRDRILELADKLSQANDAEEMLDELSFFYKNYGVGKFGLHKAFRIKSDDYETNIEPIRNIRHVHLDDLVGYEIAKNKLIENTEAFLAGKRANNCLLYGDAGTGKSSCIKAIANEYYDRGLRIIEIYKHQFKDLNDVIAQIKGRNYKFIIYMDDLSFEEFETEYKYLKAIIEGGLEKKPENVLIYATSNRRHLIRESFKDKPAVLDDDLHRNDTVQEKLSLASRFGVTIYFGSPDKKEFDEIVRVLAKRERIDMDEKELVAEAQKWEMSHGGLSGRTAQQFIDYILGTKM